VKIIISNGSDAPIYEQIMIQFKELIMKGDIEEGQPLPSIRSLAKELQISVVTTKRAYDELEKEGYIVTFAGKGSYVAATNKEFFREARLTIVEEKLFEAVSSARVVGLTLAEMQEMLILFYEEE